jgi:hypothetical protein
VDVAKALRDLLPILAALGESYQVAKIKKALEQFNCQIFGIAAGINLWWQAVEQSLSWENLDELTQNWLVGYLLGRCVERGQKTAQRV